MSLRYMLIKNLNHQRKKFLHVILSVPFLRRIAGRRGSSNLAASKIEAFAIIVYIWKPLTIIAKDSILDTKEVPDPPVKCVSMTLFALLKRSFKKKKIMRGGLKTAFTFY